jgi:hypothetical protein
MADIDALTPQEQQYFESGGEAAPEAPVETPAVEPEPELVLEASADTPVAEPEKAQEPHKHVPLPVLLEERNKARAQREQFEQERIKWAEDKARLQERMDIIARSMQQRQEAPPPQFDDDPIAATRYGFEQTGKAVQSLEEQVNSMRAEQEQAQRAQQLTHAAIAAETAFKKSAPDYDQAIEHLVKTRASELQALGYQGPQILQVMQQERAAVLEQSLRSGRNPAETLYNLSRVRGFAPKAVEPPAEQRMQKLEAGSKAASGIDNVAGRQSKTIGIQSLIEMSDDEFYKISSDEKAFRRLFGE